MTDVRARRTADRPDRADYTGAVYGSLLAASVLVGSSPREDPASPPSLVALLLATGLVFWLAHVFARLTGDRALGIEWSWAEIRSVGATEWPLVQAAFPPAAAVSAGWLLGLADTTTAWLGLMVALVGQMGWGMAASFQAGARTGWVLASGLVNLLLGVIIIGLKVLLPH